MEDRVDASLYTAIDGLAGHVGVVDTFFKLISSYGQYLMLLALVGIWFWPRLDRAHRQWAVITAAIATALALGINQVIIHIYQRPRPFITHPAAHVLLAKSHDPSFP